MKRLKGLRWETTDAAFIMLNGDGTITPIFRKPEDLNKNILSMFKKYEKRMFADDLKTFENM